MGARIGVRTGEVAWEEKGSGLSSQVLEMVIGLWCLNKGVSKDEKFGMFGSL